MDQDAINLTKAIAKQEGNDPNNYSGDGGTSAGAYQWNNGTTVLKKGEIPSNFKRDAQLVGLDANDFSAYNQDMVAYNKVKKWKDEGKTVDQISSLWNAGDEDSWKPGTVQKHGNTPQYANNVYNNYLALKGTQPTDNGTQTPKPQGEVQQPQSLGMTVLNFLGTATGQKGLGEDIGNSLGTSYGKKQYQEAVDSWKETADNVQNMISENKAAGKDTTKLEATLKAHMDSMPDIKKFIPNVPDKTASQIAADIGQSVLGLAGGAIVGGGSAAARIAGGTAIGAAGGALSSVQEGSTDPNEIAKNAGEGALVGGIAGSALEGLSQAAKGLIGGVRGAFTHLSAEDIASIARNTEIPAEQATKNMSQAEQSQYYKVKSSILSKGLAEEGAANDAKFAEEAASAKKQIIDAKQTVGATANIKTDEVKPVAAKLYTDMSKIYVAKVNDALSAAEEKGFSKLLHPEDLSSQIDSHLENDSSGIAQEIKSDLGINDGGTLPIDEKTGLPTIQTTDTTQKISTGDILSTAKEYMQQISNASRSGAKTFTASEYQLMQKYTTLMKVLEENGVDLKEANAFWKKWAPLRKTITTEVRPFNLPGEAKTTFGKTLINATKEATTAGQMETKLQAQDRISAIEKAIEQSQGLKPGSMKGTLTREMKEAVGKLSRAAQAKVDLTELAEQTAKELKEKGDDLIRNPEKPGSVAYDKYNSARVAERKAGIKKAVGNALKYLGIGALGVEGIKHAI